MITLTAAQMQVLDRCTARPTRAPAGTARVLVRAGYLVAVEYRLAVMLYSTTDAGKSALNAEIKRRAGAGSGDTEQVALQMERAYAIRRRRS